MIEEYENWEDSIRKTFIELADFQMKQYSDPIEFVIEFAWANGCDLFTINNAKDELKQLKKEKYPLEFNDAIDQLVRLCESAINTGKWQITPSLVYNAKANLYKLRASKKELAEEVYSANDFATEELNLYLETAKELGSLQKCLQHPVAWAKINDHGDLYDLRLQNNPYVDQSKVIPLYRIDHGKV